MELWLKQLIFLLLAAATTAMVKPRQYLSLDETEKRVKVSAGSTLYLNCCLSTAEYQRYRITWRFNSAGPVFTNSNKIFEIMISEQNSSNDCKNINKSYVLSAVNMTNTGWYFCNITNEIPHLHHNHSNGTEVVVLDSDGTTNSSNVTNIKDFDGQSDSWWLWIALGVSSFILLVLPVICVLFTRRRENREEPIYANARYPNKQPSPRPDMSGEAVRLKTASSSQNLRTPSPARYDEGKRREKS